MNVAAGWCAVCDSILVCCSACSSVTHTYHMFFRVTGQRTAPSLTFDNWKTLAPVGMWAALSHAFSVLAMGAGAVSFGQIVKAAEPVFAAATNAVLLKVLWSF